MQCKETITLTIKNKNKMKTTVNATIAGFPHAVVTEDENNFYIDLRTGLGVAVYPKCDFTLEQAIENEESPF